MRSFEELVDVQDPAWPELQRQIDAAGARVERLPAPPDAGRETLVALQVTTRSTLGALALETGGLAVDGGWLRVLGAGGPRMSTSLRSLNGLSGQPPLVRGALVVGFDAAGGLFAANGGGLPGPTGHVFYFSPDRLAWEDLDGGHTAFVDWALRGDLDDFYGELRWPSWREDLARTSLDEVFASEPPPWARDRQEPSPVLRRASPLVENTRTLFSVLAQLARA